MTSSLMLLKKVLDANSSSSLPSDIASARIIVLIRLRKRKNMLAAPDRLFLMIFFVSHEGEGGKSDQFDFDIAAGKCEHDDVGFGHITDQECTALGR